jgi:hypothetical protein
LKFINTSTLEKMTAMYDATSEQAVTAVLAKTKLRRLTFSKRGENEVLGSLVRCFRHLLEMLTLEIRSESICNLEPLLVLENLRRCTIISRSHSRAEDHNEIRVLARLPRLKQLVLSDNIVLSAEVMAEFAASGIAIDRFWSWKQSLDYP